MALVAQVPAFHCVPIIFDVLRYTYLLPYRLSILPIPRAHINALTQPGRV